MQAHRSLGASLFNIKNCIILLVSGLEIRTLEILPPGMSITSPALAKKNLVTQDDEDGVTFRFQNYKTSKTYGSDTTSLKASKRVYVHNIIIVLCQRRELEGFFFSFVKIIITMIYNSLSGKS